MKLCPCGNVAKFLCDKPVPLSRDEINGPTATCDAPLCDACRVQKGETFSCGSGRCVPDSFDLCRRCATKEALGLT